MTSPKTSLLASAALIALFSTSFSTAALAQTASDETSDAFDGTAVEAETTFTAPVGMKPAVVAPAKPGVAATATGKVGVTPTVIDTGTAAKEAKAKADAQAKADAELKAKLDAERKVAEQARLKAEADVKAQAATIAKQKEAAKKEKDKKGLTSFLPSFLGGEKKDDEKKVEPVVVEPKAEKAPEPVKTTPEAKAPEVPVTAPPPVAQIKQAPAPSVSGGPDLSKTLVGVAGTNGSFKTFIGYAERANIMPMLKSPGERTIFMPSDAAFEKLPAKLKEELAKPEGTDKLNAILTYHVVNGKMTGADLKGHVNEPNAMQGAVLKIDGMGDKIKVNGATVIKADISSTNGVIHEIDQVLLPPGMQAAPTPAPTPAKDPVKEEE